MKSYCGFYGPSLRLHNNIMMMRIMLYLALMLASTFSFSIGATDSLSGVTNTPSLGGFPYKISQGFGSEMASSFINFINSASALYRDDYKQNILYVHASMIAAYGTEEDFGIIIQGNSTSTYTDSFIYGGIDASFSAGINMINPSWSYYAYFMDKSDDNQMEYIPPSGRGAGIDDAKAEGLNQILKKSDGLICRCNNIPWYLLGQYDGHRWNIACHSGPITHAYVPVKNQMWMATNPGPCHHLIYVLF